MIGNSGSRLIAVVMNFERRERVNTVQNPFFGEIIGALETEIRRAGYYMLLYTSGSAEETVRLASTWNVEESYCSDFRHGKRRKSVNF